MPNLMSQALLAENTQLQVRATAALAAVRPSIQAPRMWVQERAYQLAATPGWSDLVDQGSEIPDEAIIARVRELIDLEPPRLSVEEA